ncbi:MAG: S1 RNA-binding domain-containing protein [Nitrospira sp.]|nr:S1 RNA-binding domain-containing protein [Nitrospira sp.]
MTTSTAQTLSDVAQVKIVSLIAKELNAGVHQVAAAVALLDEGSTVPFIARYRKEATGNLDDTQLRTLEERLLYLRELEVRRAAILASIEEQGKLTDALRERIEAAATKQAVEDLYLPFKPKRRTRAQIAREAGLEPLADGLLADPTLNPEQEALQYIRVVPAADGVEAINVPDAKTALEGTRDILMERFAETADLLAALRARLWEQGVLTSTVMKDKEQAEEEKFRDYYAYTETIKTIPSHRALAIFRGRTLGVLKLELGLGESLDAVVPHPCVSMIAAHAGIQDRGRPADKWLAAVCDWTWRVKIHSQLSIELLVQLREAAEAEAIKIFARNLHELLLAAPAGPKAVLGLDPGIRTGCKVAVVDATGKLLDTATVYPHQPRNDWQGSLETLVRLVVQHGVELIAIGNGTASRETDKLAVEVIKLVAAHKPDQKIAKIVVSEAGASVYSASAFAAAEFPQLDVSVRGAVSIARRLQDPLAELVKIEPKAIGVGQYQHDVNQRALARSLDATVEDCVNAVGVNLNTASVPLLERVSGLNKALAKNIVDYRDANGPFSNRMAIRDVPRLGEKTFEQAAGFLRIPDGDNPLDRSAVHPEAYPVVERILTRLGTGIAEVMRQPAGLKGLSPDDFTDEKFGVPTVRDILTELEKPGRDPRPEFKTATFREGVESLSDLQPGMVLEGVVTNVAAFGAFVDIGVHQDGLVHVSALANKFVKDPHEVVKPGQVVKVKVLDVDLKQSSNDVIPTAIHIAASELMQQQLLPALTRLRKALDRKAKEFDKIVKIGRTHLQDATPVRLGQEFGGYARQIELGIQRVKRAQEALSEVALGGTAVGTGLNCHPQFSKKVMAVISKETGCSFKEAKNHFEAQSAQDSLVEASGELRTIAVSLMKIANDIRWLGSGPRCGLGEINLPETQPGSSIMPGKVNPVIAESVTMVCAQVIGNDVTVTVGGQAANFELIVMMPVMAYNLLQSIELLAAASNNFAAKCIEGIKANEERCKSLIEESLAMCTALAPAIGYEAAAKLAKDAYKSGKTVRQVAKEQKVLPEKKLTELLDPWRMTEPGGPVGSAGG